MAVRGGCVRYKFISDHCPPPDHRGLNERRTALHSLERLQEEVEKLWIELQVSNGECACESVPEVCWCARVTQQVCGNVWPRGARDTRQGPWGTHGSIFLSPAASLRGPGAEGVGAPTLCSSSR